MRRLLLVLLFACPVLVVGVVGVALAAWALVAVGLNGLVTPVLVLGLSAAVPLSIVAADRIMPGGPAQARPVVACPNCGTSVLVGFASKPEPFPDW